MKPDFKKLMGRKKSLTSSIIIFCIYVNNQAKSNETRHFTNENNLTLVILNEKGGSTVERDFMLQQKTTAHP